MKPTRTRFPFFASLVTTLTVGCSGGAPPDVDTADGALSNARTEHAGLSVGVCQGTLDNQGRCREGTLRCSGTLVAPNLVLTARQCVQTSVAGPSVATDPCDKTFTSTPHFPGGTHITTDASVTMLQPQWFDVANILVPSGDRACRDDAALLVLTQDVPKNVARYVEVDFGAPAAQYTTVTLAGRGAKDITYQLDASRVWTGQVASIDLGNLMRRVVENVPIECLTNAPNPGCTILSHQVPAPHTFTLPHEMMVIGGPPATLGDSGGGVFDAASMAQAWNGVLLGPSLVGIVGWSYIGPNGKPHKTGALRLSHLKDFLIDGAKQARGARELPHWADPTRPRPQQPAPPPPYSMGIASAPL